MAFHSSLAGRTAVVTGASRGIGREMAATMAKAGMRVALIGSVEGRALQEIVAECGDGCFGVAVDVADHKACEGAVARIIASAPSMCW